MESKENKKNIIQNPGERLSTLTDILTRLRLELGCKQMTAEERRALNETYSIFLAEYELLMPSRH